ncbi:glycosyltransferase [Mucilaginibacter pallidiroseus]|uniref:Glycosyltransferase n=1 Tax=Mucilaginibacter pallidiroseus TaxID=2599295 RepID=A0A563U2F1_9SPHI|nr:glycosyltransferase family 2 protein [Mucilaginibacter pallidiroseus]TWR25209.1 glycosyltransferase [Mucilaginibacter pallidiroseus]
MENFIEGLPKVSIVTVVYNAVQTVEDTVLSVLNQTYPNIEYIVIDGGSTDGTLEVLNRYQDRITRFVSEPDKGIADGFNKGIALASGDWIGMINADDWYEPNAVELIMKAVSVEDNVCCGNIMLMGKNGYKRLKKSKVNRLNFGMYIMHPSCFIRKRVYNAIGNYNITLKIAMDFEMLMRIRAAGYQIKYINKLIANMRVGGASGNVWQMHKEEMAVMRLFLRGRSYSLSYIFKKLDMIRWRYFYKDPFGAVQHQ